MNEESIYSPRNPKSSFSYEDIVSTLEYLHALRNRELFTDRGQEKNITTQSDWRNSTYFSEILAKKYYFTDRNFQDAVSGVVEAWKKNPEGFSHIFETSQGSIYFMLEDGKCIRFKRSKLIWVVERTLIFDHVFFLPEYVFTVLNDLHEKGELQEGIFELSQSESGILAYMVPAENFHPFEFRLHKYANDIKFSYDNNVLRFNKESGPFASGYHLGHKIVNLIK